MSVIQAPAGANGLDTDAVITAPIAAALAGMGFSFAVRYVSRGTPNQAGDITAVEVGTIRGAGLAVMLVQHCPPAYWTPSAALGTQYGQAASANARLCGYPLDATLWLDLENMRPGSAAVDLCGYANAWSRAVAGVGYQPGLYYSADVPLTAQQLYLDLVATRYWRGLSRDAPLVAMRGACMQQFLQQGQVAGIDIDRDVITPDAFGGLPMWAAPG